MNQIVAAVDSSSGEDELYTVPFPHREPREAFSTFERDMGPPVRYRAPTRYHGHLTGHDFCDLTKPWRMAAWDYRILGCRMNWLITFLSNDHTIVALANAGGLIGLLVLIVAFVKRSYSFVATAFAGSVKVAYRNHRIAKAFIYYRGATDPSYLISYLVTLNCANLLIPISGSLVLVSDHIRRNGHISLQAGVALFLLVVFATVVQASIMNGLECYRILRVNYRVRRKR